MMFVFKEQSGKVPGTLLDPQCPVLKETACHIDWEKVK